MILSVTPNPCVDKTVFLDTLSVGKKNVSSRVGCVPGGKGNNVARAVRALGHDAAAMVIVGGPPGRHVVDMIEHDDGVRCIPVWIDGMTRTITTVLETGLHRQTPLFEPGPSVTRAEMDTMLGQFRHVVGEARVVTFNGTVPDPALRSLYREMIAIAREAGVKTILDSHGPEFAEGLRAHPDMVKPNDTEAAELVGFEIVNESDRLRAVDHFHGIGIPLVVLSLGPDGALVSRDGERLRVTPPPIEEVNAVGSGDALVAGFAIGLEEGLSLEAMARLGVAAGTANAMSWDIGHFTAEAVKRLSRELRIEPWTGHGTINARG